MMKRHKKTSICPSQLAGEDDKLSCLINSRKRLNELIIADTTPFGDLLYSFLTVSKDVEASSVFGRCIWQIEISFYNGRTVHLPLPYGVLLRMGQTIVSLPLNLALRSCKE
ncbi:hypothetical protein VN97_g5832 [Penicillium thymicola]|uniref:Uncharacterized protein n=1 Tax=Penicillium thymicola TaxID=293382 RepID=A0AAI9THU4_PENTH|nr:hypothetical protein VN97_g5832 [Penicillium thymicola]